MMGVVGLEAERFAGQVKCADLSATVREQPVDANGAKLDLIIGSGFLALRVDFRIRRKEAHRLRSLGRRERRNQG